MKDVQVVIILVFSAAIIYFAVRFANQRYKPTMSIKKGVKNNEIVVICDVWYDGEIVYSLQEKPADYTKKSIQETKNKLLKQASVFIKNYESI